MRQLARLKLCWGAEFLRRLAEKEHEHGIPFDRDVDAFLQACTVEGKASHPLTNFFLRILGLEVQFSCAGTDLELPAACQLCRAGVLPSAGQAVRQLRVGLAPCAAP